MAVFTSPSVSPEEPLELVSEALRSLTGVGIEIDDFLTVVEIAAPDGARAWRWYIELGAPQVIDESVLRVYFTASQSGRWAKGPHTHPRLRRGVVVLCDDLWVVAAGDWLNVESDAALIGEALDLLADPLWNGR